MYTQQLPIQSTMPAMLKALSVLGITTVHMIDLRDLERPQEQTISLAALCESFQGRQEQQSFTVIEAGTL